MSERKLVFHHHKSLRKFTDKRKQYLIEQVERLKLLPQPEQRIPYCQKNKPEFDRLALDFW